MVKKLRNQGKRNYLLNNDREPPICIDLELLFVFLLVLLTLTLLEGVLGNWLEGANGLVGGIIIGGGGGMICVVCKGGGGGGVAD